MPSITTTSMWTQRSNRMLTTPVADLEILDVIDRIEKLNTQLAAFWSKSDGWAPAHVAGLLGSSRLDWQVSLSGTLRMWAKDELSAAELILGWANLGSLIEGSIKLFLSVYFETYQADIENLKKANAFDHKKSIAHSPDGLTLERLRQYCVHREIFDSEHLSLMEMAQQRRNAIHAFKDRPIGDANELDGAMRGYLAMLREVVRRLPFADDMYVPRE